MAAAISFREAPVASSARTSRSTETLGSHASIFATRDWLEPSRFASSVCVSPWLVRRSRSVWLSASFISTKAASSSERSRNSSAEQSFQPASSKRLRFVSFLVPSSAEFVVAPQPLLADLDHVHGRLACGLLEDLGDDEFILNDGGFRSEHFSEARLRELVGDCAVRPLAQIAFVVTF